MPCRRRRLLRPQLFDELVGRDDPAPIQEQVRQKRTLLRRAE
jgi:hypothetical protein